MNYNTNPVKYYNFKCVQKIIEILAQLHRNANCWVYLTADQLSMNIALEMGSYCFYETILLSNTFRRGKKQEIMSILLTFLSLSMCVYYGDLGVWWCLKANTEGASILNRPGNEPLAIRFLCISTLSQNLSSPSIHCSVAWSEMRKIRLSFLLTTIDVTNRYCL